MKLPPWTAYPLQTIIGSACMAVVMSSSLTLVRTGLTPGWLETSLRNAVIAFPIALTSTFIIVPFIRRFVAAVTSPSPARSLAAESRAAEPRRKGRRPFMKRLFQA